MLFKDDNTKTENGTRGAVFSVAAAVIYSYLLYKEIISSDSKLIVYLLISLVFVYSVNLFLSDEDDSSDSSTENKDFDINSINKASEHIDFDAAEDAAEIEAVEKEKDEVNKSSEDKIATDDDIQKGLDYISNLPEMDGELPSYVKKTSGDIDLKEIEAKALTELSSFEEKIANAHKK